MKLFEIIDTKTIWRREEFLDEVIPHCGKYLRAVQASQRWLLRGIPTREAWFGPQESLLREPRDSEKKSSQAFDEILKELGCVALRQNSIFVTTNWSKADYYTESGPKKGSVYVILCDDNCHFTWTDYEDIILRVERLPFDQEKVQRWAQEYKSYLRLKPNLDHAERLFANLSARLSDVAAYREALRIPQLQAHVPDMESMIDREKFQQQFKPQCDNFPGLVKAMTEQKEIYVRGRYWGIQLTSDLDQELEKRGLPPAMFRKSS